MSEIKTPDIETVVQGLRFKATADIASQAHMVHHQLITARDDLNYALKAMESGQSLHGQSPLGHQTPFDLAKHTDRLQSMIELALMLGISQEDIDAAYAKGVQR